MEYELIDISFELNYESEEEQTPLMACDEGAPEAEEIRTIERDADGIPMGSSMEEIRKRESVIADFFQQWRKAHANGKIFNTALQDDILIRNVSFVEAKEHSAKSYKSTCAVLKLDEVVANALPVRRVIVKKSDKNQGNFSYMLIMVYRHPELGTVKVTVGVRLSGERIQYGISALRPGEPLIKDTKTQKKKRSSKK